MSDDDDRGEYELSDAIDLLIQSGHTIDAIRLDGWRIDVGYPEDRDRAEERLNDRDDDEETTEDNGVDEESVDDYLDISRAPRIDAAREQQHEPVVPRSRPGFMSAPCRVYERFTHVRTGVGSENICTGLTDDADA